MRVLVCGGRDYTERVYLFETLDRIASILKVDCVIEGEARGADLMAREWAEFAGIPFEPYPADWKRLGKAAGMIRNRQMLKEGKPDLIVAFPTPGSVGTAGMVGLGRAAHVKVWVLPENRPEIDALGEGVFS